MALTRCESRRHFYEASIYAECPHCAGTSSTLCAGAAPPPAPAEALPIADLVAPSAPAGSAEAPAPFTSRFRPIAALSEGGMGKLYLVEEVLYRRCVALKVMHTHLADSPEMFQQFIREAVITARLEHPHIIPVYEIGTLETGQVFYTMRYIDGHPFSKLSAAVGVRERVRMLRDAASAVDFAHSQGLWHRDLTPANLLVGAWGDVYVIDWGLVSVIAGRTYELKAPTFPKPSGPSLLDELFTPPPQATPGLFSEESIRLTMSGGILAGTPAYMSPERFAGDVQRLGIPSDVWAFGVMLFEVLTGQHPFPRCVALGDLMGAVVGAEIPSPRDLNADAPEELSALCEQMLERDLDRRLPSLGELVNRLTRFLEMPASTAPPDSLSARSKLVDSSPKDH